MASPYNLYKEIYDEFMNDMDINSSTGPGTINKNDLKQGELAASLAQAKGELNALLDRAARDGILQKNKDKITILQKDEYIKRIGDLPKRIKALQHQLEP